MSKWRNTYCWGCFQGSVWWGFLDGFLQNTLDFKSLVFFIRTLNFQERVLTAAGWGRWGRSRGE